MNLVPADLSPDGARFGSVLVRFERDDLAATYGPTVTLGIRPEDVAVSRTEGPGLATRVDLVEELGADGFLYGHSETRGQQTNIVARVDGSHRPVVGDTVYITPKSGRVHFFDANSGLRLSRAVVG